MFKQSPKFIFYFHSLILRKIQLSLVLRKEGYKCYKHVRPNFTSGNESNYLSKLPVATGVRWKSQKYGKHTNTRIIFKNYWYWYKNAKICWVFCNEQEPFVKESQMLGRGGSSATGGSVLPQLFMRFLLELLLGRADRRAIARVCHRTPPLLIVYRWAPGLLYTSLRMFQRRKALLRSETTGRSTVLLVLL